MLRTKTVAGRERGDARPSWRADFGRACNGGTPGSAVNQELQPVIERYTGLPFELFNDELKGVEMDLDINRYETSRNWSCIATALHQWSGC